MNLVMPSTLYFGSQTLITGFATLTQSIYPSLISFSNSTHFQTQQYVRILLFVMKGQRLSASSLLSSISSWKSMSMRPYPFATLTASQFHLFSHSSSIWILRSCLFSSISQIQSTTDPLLLISDILPGSLQIRLILHTSHSAFLIALFTQLLCHKWESRDAWVHWSHLESAWHLSRFPSWRAFKF